MASHHLSNVVTNVKVAREMALLGNYKGSLEKYNLVHEDIHNYIENERPCTHQRNWQTSNTLIQRESEYVKNLSNAISWFTNGEVAAPNIAPVTTPAPAPAPTPAPAQPSVSYKPSTSRYISNTSASRPLARKPTPTHSSNAPWSSSSSSSSAHPSTSEPSRVSSTRTSSTSSSNSVYNSRVSNSSVHTRGRSAVSGSNNIHTKPPVPSTSRGSAVSTERKTSRKAPLDMGRGKTGQANGPSGSGANSNSNNTSETVNGHPKYVNDTYPELVKIIESSIMDTTPNVYFKDIAELDDAKRVLEETVMYPIWMPEFFQGIRKPWKGVLLFGPPGTGKTMLAKAVATECQTTFFNVSASAIASKFRGESEQLVHILFEMARHYAPSTIFLDELDSISSKRGVAGEHESSRRVKSQLLIEMDGASVQQEGKPVAVLGATNFPWDLDEALIRRLEKRIYIPLPGFEGRKELLKLNFRNVKLADDVDLDELAQATEGYSGSDLCGISRDAAMAELRKLRQMGISPLEIRKLGKEVTEAPITMEALTDAVSRIHSSVGKNDIEKYEKWYSEFGSI